MPKCKACRGKGVVVLTPVTDPSGGAVSRCETCRGFGEVGRWLEVKPREKAPKRKVVSLPLPGSEAWKPRG